MSGLGLARRHLLALAAAAWLAPGAIQGAEFTALTVATERGAVRLRVELVDTPERRARGLMFRQSMPRDQGMLFDFFEEQPVSFWMRNTPLPLDLLFIAADGRIRHIHRRARPYDETPIPSVFPVRAVLEINGGEAARRGIAVGDLVGHAIFKSPG